MKYLLLISLLLSGCATVTPVEQPAPEEVVESVPALPAQPSKTKKPANCAAVISANASDAKCPKAGHPYKVWDMAARADRKLVELMVCSGFETVMKYYDWIGFETIAGKIPNDTEMALFREYGLTIALVFQHNNRPIEVFASAMRRERDVKEILDLAGKWKQPKGSAVYLGVDHDHWSAQDLETVRGYFKAIAPRLRAVGYRVGMYGSGANCISLSGAGLIDKSIDGKPLCFIAGSSGWSRTGEVLKSGKYVLQQKVNQLCQGKNLDYSIVNAKEFGQWEP